MRTPAAETPLPDREPRRQPALADGFLAALPLFAAYELSLAFPRPGMPRSSAESLASRLFSLLGPDEHALRIGCLIAAAALSWFVRARAAPARRLVDHVFVGLVVGVALGPLLYALVQWLGDPGLLPSGAAGLPRRSPALLLRLAGGAPWEELLFRVAGYGLLFLLVSRAGSFLGLPRSAAWAGADLVALLGSALFFAAFHLDPLQRALGSRGEPFRADVLLWRLCAGLLLGGLFRWRGLGVTAWAHAALNLELALAAG